MQLSFGLVLAVFLTVSVGEGRAYDVGFDYLGADFEESAGFIGKPQLIGQTVLTGETQYAVTYTVESGDSLLTIAQRYNTNVNTIIEANNLKVAEIEKIRPGTELAIPATDSENSLAWLDELNQLKAEEAERARQAELRRLATQRQQRAVGLPRIARNVGDVVVLGRRTNLNSGTAFNGQCTSLMMHLFPAFRSYVMGNGGQWLVSARRYGFQTSSSMVEGWVGVSNEAGPGHVFHIQKVHGDGTMTIREMNYIGPYWENTRRVVISLGGTHKGSINPYR